SFGVALRLDLLSFSSPIEHVPGSLKADAADAVRKHAAEIDRTQREQREADVRNSLGTRKTTFELRLALLHSRQTDLRTGRQGFGIRVSQRNRLALDDARDVDIQRSIDRSPHQAIELLFLGLDRVVHLEQLEFSLDELCFDVQQVGLQRHPLNDLLARLAIEL